jgi:hypothetical protein
MIQAASAAVASASSTRLTSVGRARGGVSNMVRSGCAVAAWPLAVGGLAAEGGLVRCGGDGRLGIALLRRGDLKTLQQAFVEVEDIIEVLAAIVAGLFHLLDFDEVEDDVA